MSKAKKTKASNITKTERDKLLRSLGMVAALHFMAHKIAIFYAGAMTTAQNIAVDEICKEVGELRQAVLDAVFDHICPSISPEVVDEAAIRAIKAEVRKHKAYTPNRMLAKLKEFEATDLGDRAEVDVNAYTLGKAIRDLREFGD